MKKDYIGIVILGAINNLPYWVVFSNLQLICRHFHKEGILGILSLSCVLLGVCATSINTFLTSKNISYRIRAIAESIFLTVGLIGVAFSQNIYFGIIFIIVTGFSSDFGEGVLLGYSAAKGRNELMGAWGVGTGISGILGSGYSFLTQFFEVPFKLNFLSVSVVGIFYLLSFYFLVDTKDSLKENEYESIVESKSINEQSDIINDENKLTICTKRLWKEALPYFLNNGMTFFFQYACITGFNECSMTRDEKEHKPYIYQLMNLIYQVGNAIGRSSLRFVKVKRIYVLT